MKLHCILGDFGTGKTRYIAEKIRRLVLEEKPARLIVPEQETMNVEDKMARFLPQNAPLFFEASNFSRLTNTIFRSLGGLAYAYATKETKIIMLWKAFTELHPHLKEAYDIQETDQILTFFHAIKELEAEGVSTSDLHAVTESLPEDHQLNGKMTDLLLLKTFYHACIEEKYADSADDLARACDLLKTQPIYKDIPFYIDSFTSFTMQEYQMMETLLAHSDLTVSLCLPEDYVEGNCYEEILHTKKRLEKLANRIGADFTTEQLPAKSLCNDLSLVGKILRQPFPEAKPVIKEPDGSLSLISGKSPFDGAHFVAGNIRKKIMAGARYRDFAILCRSAEDYQGILDTALEHTDIPFFLSTRTDFSSLEAIKFIDSAFAILLYGWRGPDVLSYLKCGFSGIAIDDVDLFESYTAKWKLSGRAYTKKEPFALNPFGYHIPTKEEDKERASFILASVNRTKDTFVPPLLAFGEEIAKEQTVRTLATALFTFLHRMGVEKKIALRAEAEKSQGRNRQAEELSRLYPAICDLLDNLVSCAGETLTTAKTFRSLLALLFKSSSLGSIPTTQDAVTIGSADLLRLEHIPHIYLFGLQDGEFPATVKEESFFSQNDRRLLSDYGFALEPDLSILSSREQFSFLRSLHLATKSCSLVYFRSDTTLSPSKPSSVIDTILETFPSIKPVSLDTLSPSEKIYHQRQAKSLLGQLQNTPDGIAIKEVLALDPTTDPRLYEAPVSFSKKQEPLSKETAKQLYKNNLRLTQSRLEKYQDCPFAYFCTYILKLDANEEATFHFASIGDFIHHVLERFFLALAEENILVQNLSEKEIEERVHLTVLAYITDICPDTSSEFSRLGHLFLQLERNATVLIKELSDEFNHCRFLPVAHEISIGEASSVTPLSFVLEDGSEVSIYGKIDRVDALYEDDICYLRVVDYKTGTKEFSVNDLEKGKNLQLLLYLFSMWKSAHPLPFANNKALMPGGVLYLSSAVKDLVLDLPKNPEETLALAKSNLKRSGIMLDAPSVISATDDTQEKRYQIKKASKNQNILSLDDMAKKINLLEEVVTGVGNHMKKGVVYTAKNQIASSENHPCKYCKMKPFCRSATD